MAWILCNSNHRLKSYILILVHFIRQQLDSYNSIIQISYHKKLYHKGFYYTFYHFKLSTIDLSISKATLRGVLLEIDEKISLNLVFLLLHREL